MLRFSFESLRVRLLLLVLLALLPAFGLIVYKGLEQRNLAAAEAKVEAMRLVGLASASQRELIDGAHQLLNGLSELIDMDEHERCDCNELLASRLEQNSQYVNFGVAGVNGDVICSAIPLSPTGEVINITDRHYFQRALQTHDFSVGSYQIDRIAKRATINFGHPIFTRHTGNVQGVIFVSLDLSFLVRAAAQAQLPERTVLTIRDSGGTILFRYPNHEQWFGMSLPEVPIVKSILSQQGWGTAQASGVDGIERLYAFAPLSSSLDPDVYMSVGIDSKTAFAKANSHTLYTLIVLGLAALLAFAAAWFGGSLFIMNQVNGLIGVTRKLKVGDLNSRCGPPYGQSEFGELALAFDEMAESLDNRTTELEKAEAKYRTLVEQVPAITYMMALDGSGKMLYVSPQIEMILGFSASEWLRDSNRWLKQLHVDDRDRVLSEHALSRSDSTPFKSEYRLIDAGGKVVWVRDEAGVCLCDKLQFPILQGIIRDITESKALKIHLQQAQKMEAIGTLAGGIAHDFNNILGAILASAEMAKADIYEESRMQRHLERILKASWRARDLVKQILAFSRQTEQQRMPVEIEIIVKEALKLLRASFPATIEIRQKSSISSAAVPGFVMADPTQVHQIIINLCTNAAHAMRERGGVLEVRLEDVDLDSVGASRLRSITPGSYMKLTVSDTGHGIDAATLDRVFDPFFTTKAPGEGTGMGLSVVHGIVTSYGGTITVDSEPGRGSSFHVFLPRIEHVGLEQRSEGEAHGELPAPTPGRGERILFVDDENALVAMWKEMLIRLGYEVTAGNSGIEALSAFRAKPDQFDLVITDQTMPGLTGLDLASELMIIRPDIPIILCTGNNATIAEDQVRAKGIRKLVMKPIGNRELATIIQEVLS